MTKKHLIWDLPLRIFHWLLVVCIAGAWYTSKQDNDMIDLHLIFGYVTLGLIVFRILWGFIGTTHSRFSQFVPTPSKLIKYIKTFNTNDNTQHHAGHNPMGSLMVLFMLVIILLQALSGLVMNDDIFTTGPYNGALDESIEAILVFIHRNSFNVIIGAIVMHLLAIAFYKISKKQSLVKPMITGKKSEPAVTKKDSISHSKVAVAALLAILVAAFVYWLVVVNAPVIEEFYY